ncbi:MAG: vitamin K epoxide reductase family protein [Patescibacteria group bacterium]|nr:vitamin K epoxide reductase family protein [Patescibacteria group bacterium]
MNTKKIIRFRRGILLASLVGFFASSYLLYTYTTGADLKCGSLVHGCDAVRLSEWASMFGIPTPIFGVIFYLSVLIILIARTYAPEYKPGLARLGQLVFGIAGFAESAFLFYIQAFIIKQFCSWCLVSAIAATVIFIFSILDSKYALEKSESIKELKFIGMSLVAFFVAGGLTFIWLIRPVEAPPISPEFIQGQIESFKPQVDTTSTTTQDENLFHKETTTTKSTEPSQSYASTTIEEMIFTATSSEKISN